MREEFQRIAICPIGVGQFEEVAPLGRAGIVDKDVEPAEFPPHDLYERLGCARLAQIEHAYGGFASFAPDRRYHLLQRLRVAAGEQEIAAFLGESQGDAAADAAARTGHERDLSIQSKLHCQLLVPARRGCIDVTASLSHWQAGE